MTQLISTGSWQIPGYRTHEFERKKTPYCICIPVINEGARLISQLDRIAALNLEADVILGDGGSVDGTADQATIRGHGVRTLLVKIGRGRLSAQLRMLFSYALTEGYRGVVMVDGNGKDGMDAIPRFLDGLRSGFDYIQGSRYLAGGYEENTPLDRKIAAKWIHAPLISLAAGFRYTDTTNGFRAVSSRVLLDPRVQPFRDIFDTYNLHYYLSVRVPRLGYRIAEIPVRRVYPASGPPPSKIGGITGKILLFKLLVEAVAGRYNP